VAEHNDAKGKSLEELSEALTQKSKELREAQDQARKVPSLKTEIVRLEGALAREKKRADSATEEAGRLEERCRALQSELRALSDVEDREETARKAAEDAECERDDARSAQRAAEERANEIWTRIGELDAEIERLRPHEEQTHALVAALDQAKGLT
jgi:translation initiation factor IF-2